MGEEPDGIRPVRAFDRSAAERVGFSAGQMIGVQVDSTKYRYSERVEMEDKDVSV